MATEDSTPPLIDAVHEDASSESIHRAHHRKNSTKTGFWGQADKIPPAGTKAYWWYLQQKADLSADFALPLRVKSWDHHEIAYWLRKIKFDKYAVAFIEEKVTGEQLIYDMNSTVLSSDLGVKILHCGKIMGEIKSLKILAGIVDEKEEMYDRQSSINRQLKDEMNDIKQVSANQQSQILMLNDECKENKIELQELKLRYKELQKNSKLDERRYAEWSMEDVLHWIMRLDDGKRFVKYEKKVHKALTEQEFDGSCLEDVEKSDVADWGVTNFKDKTFLFKQIQNMTQQTVQKEENIKENMNVAIADHEGNVSGGHYR